MIPIKHLEVPHLALWKSCVSEVLMQDRKQKHGDISSTDTIHPIMLATDNYCNFLQQNQIPPKPTENSVDETEVLTYLSYLHHCRAHARITDDSTIENDLKQQTEQYKFGNPLWQKMFVQYFEYYWQYPYHKGNTPKYRSWQAVDAGNGDLQYGVIDWKLPSCAKVAIVGDIGTGTDVAASVLVSALKFKPDAILHLGDVYFSGTTFEMNSNLVELVQNVMNSEDYHVPFFTVPGNHEYFTGAVPFFHTLDSNKLVVTSEQQQRASYFCLRTEDNGWQFLGLDTGYHGHYMNVPDSAKQSVLEHLHKGKIENPKPNTFDSNWPDNNPYFKNTGDGNLTVRDTTTPVDQVTVRYDEAIWHRDKIDNFTGRTILLSHHQLYSALQKCGIIQKQKTGADGKTIPDCDDFNREWVNTGLWRQFGYSFQNKTAAWIWGHEHNLEIFEDNYRPSDWPKDTPDANGVFKTLPKGRCAGHSAIPVEQNEFPYKQKYPVSLKQSDLTLGISDGWYNRGFEILDIKGAGHPATLSYFQVSGADPTPIQIFSEEIV